MRAYMQERDELSRFWTAAQPLWQPERQPAFWEPAGVQAWAQRHPMLAFYTQVHVMSSSSLKHCTGISS